MPGFLKGKKLIIGAVALILAAIAAVVAVSFTYAAYRKSLLSEGGATVAGMVADYVRGNAYRYPGEQIEYDDSSSDGSIVISDLSPGDILDYSFFCKRLQGKRRRHHLFQRGAFARHLRIFVYIRIPYRVRRRQDANNAGSAQRIAVCR